MRVAVVGCGLMGSRRATVARQCGSEIVVVADIDLGRANMLAADLDCAATTDWLAAVTRDDVDAVVVSTTNDSLTPVTAAALGAGKHVLCEKPLGRDPVECCLALDAAKASGRVLQVGFNHRYHPAVSKALERAQHGDLGELVVLRCRYGHGGRPGYEREWRADAAVAGGGELLDQGVHAIDLFCALGGTFDEAMGWVASSFWTTEVEDNAFALFRAKTGLVASLHVSWTQWRNLFSLEAFGRDGYLAVDGLGGSYGPERLTFGRRPVDEGLPIEEFSEFPGPDVSWEAEWKEFVGAVAEGREPQATGLHALEAVRMVHAIYQSSRLGAAVALR